MTSRVAASLFIVLTATACTSPNPSASACAGITCATPTASSCVDGDTLRTFDARGTCADGRCSYAATNVHCEHGCAADVLFYSPASCNKWRGQCSWSSATMQCPTVCVSVGGSDVSDICQ